MLEFGINNLYAIYTLFFFIFVILNVSFINFNFLKLKDFFYEKKYNNIRIYIITNVLILTFCCVNTISNYLQHNDISIFKQNTYFILSLLFINIAVVNFTLNKTKNMIKKNLIFIFGFFVLLISLIVALIQVLFGLTSSFTVNSQTGLSVYRATAVFLNPNTYAVWLCVIYMFLSYNLVAYKRYFKNYNFYGMHIFWYIFNRF